MRPDHSDGAMIDSTGQVVGINVMINGPEVGMAILAHTVQKFLKELGRVERAHEPRHAERMLA